MKVFLFEENNINYPNNSLMANNSICFIISGFLIQILDPLEINFNIKENLILNDLETNAKLKVDESKKYKNFYDKQLNDLQNNLKDICKSSNWSYLLHNTSKNIKPILLEICKGI